MSKQNCVCFHPICEGENTVFRRLSNDQAGVNYVETQYFASLG